MIFNLLGKTILENSIGALKHHLKKKEVARNTEIECQKEIQIERIKQEADRDWETCWNIKKLFFKVN